MAYNLNLIHLIGNLTRNPELRYTGSGRPVCTFGLATNRSWKTASGELKEESSYHRIVAWEILAEQCAQLLVKGRKVYVQGRLAYRTYQKDDEQREVAEIVIEDMLLLDAKPTGKAEPRRADTSRPVLGSAVADTPPRPEEESRPTHPVATLPAQRISTNDEIADAIPF